MATISAFSPQRFFTIANGHPVEPHTVLDSATIEVPTHGAHTLSLTQSPHIRSLWISGIVAQSEERARFIHQIQEGKIPLPLTPYSTSDITASARLVSPHALHEENCSVASALGLTEHLLDLVERSEHTRCPICSATLAVFTTPRSLALDIAKRWNGVSITVALEGPADTIRPWAEELGYSLQSTHEGHLAARIDTFLCSEAHCLGLEEVLRSTLRLDNSWFTISDGASITHVAWSGRCESCEHVEPRINTSRLREIINKGFAKESEPGLSRIIEGTPLGELLQLPLRSIAQSDRLRSLLSANLALGVKALNLEEISLTDRTTQLSPQALMSISLLGSEVENGNSHSVTVIDAPLSLFSSEQRQAHLSISSSLAAKSPYVWLSDESLPIPGSSNPPPAHSDVVGTFTFQETAADHRKVRTNRCLVIGSSKTTHHKSIAQDLFRSLEGSPSPLISFLGERLFSEFFVPYFTPRASRSKMVIHELGAMEPLAKLFAASHQAKMQGLAAKTFTIGQLKREPSVCERCAGTGLIFEEIRSRIPETRPCTSCWGTRLRSPAREVTFKGRALWEVLNEPLASSIQLLKSLPKMGNATVLIDLLGFGDISLGMPVALLSPSSRRLMAIARAMLEGSLKRPSVIIVEEPYAGLSSQQIEGIQRAVRHPQFMDKTAWVFTTHAANLGSLEDLRYTL